MFEAGVLLEEFDYDFSWEQVRAARARELVDSDWRALKDVTLSNAWKEYRQALRDLPQDNATANDAADSFTVMPAARAPRARG